MDLVGYLAMLRRRWLVIALCLIAGVGGGLALGHHGVKQYEATAQCIVNIPPSTGPAAQLAGAQLTSNFVGTYTAIATSRAVYDRTAALMTRNGDAGAGSGSLSASNEAGTYLIDIKATASTPLLAEETANAGAHALSAHVGELNAVSNNQVTVQVDNKASLPTVAIRPRPKLDLTLGIIFGLLAGLLLAAVLEALDRTVKSSQQADALTSAPLLGLVPKRRSAGLVLGRDADGPEGEPYRSLRTAVRFLDPDHPLRTILITSPTPNDGKTTTAANLAVALGLSGERVVIVDADLRRASLAEMFGVERSVGLTSLVLGRASLDDVLQDWGHNVKILASGPLPPNPSEILGSQFLNSVLRELVGHADVVIIDAPPVLPVADAVALGAQVDGVIMVIRHGSTLRMAVAEAHRRLDSVGARVVGYVLNAVPSSDARSYYADYEYDTPGDFRPAATRRPRLRRRPSPAAGPAVTPPAAPARPVGTARS